MSSIASTINAKIKTLLEAISTGGGYQNEVKLVSRIFRAPQDRDEDVAFPYICFGPLKYEEEALDANNTLKDIRATLTLAFWVEYAEATVDSDILDFYSDVKKALETDYTLGNLVIDSNVGACEVAEITPNAGFVSAYTRFDFRFTHSMGDPTT